jgi:hypothetical protein
MTELDTSAIIRAHVAIVIAELTEEERIGLRLSLALGSDLYNRSWSYKLAPLFTQDGGTKMHEETIAALRRVA